MTLNYGIFDVSDPQNPDRVYSAALLSRILSKHIRDGIVHGDGGELAVTVTDPPAMSVQVGTGTAMVQGRFCESDDVLTLAVPAAHATYARIDRVVVRLNASPGRVIDILVKKGTPAPSPAPPGLTRTPETWELSLAQIFVAAGATMVRAADITDERGNTSLCGVAAPVYVPSSQVEVVGAMNMQGHALTGLPVPIAGTDAARKDMGGATLQNLGAPVNPNDAARKSYVDAKVAGFGISDITIDADKDWNGKSITNMKSLTLTSAAHEALKIVYPSNNIIASSDALRNFNSVSDWKVVKAATIPYNGALRIQHTHAATGGGSEEAIKSRICCDGEVRATYHSTRDLGPKTYVTDAMVRAGSVVTIEGMCYAGYISGVKYMGSAGVIPLGTVPLTITVTQD